MPAPLGTEADVDGAFCTEVEGGWVSGSIPGARVAGGGGTGATSSTYSANAATSSAESTRTQMFYHVRAKGGAR